MEKDFMKLALAEAKKAMEKDEVPIGCVIVKDGEVIARGHNQKEKKQSAVFHAEIVAINRATRKLGTWHLDDCEIYVTLEPCLMCAGAIINSRIRKVIFGASDPKGGAFGSNTDVKLIPKLNHYPLSQSGLHKEECEELLKTFFRKKRKISKEI